MRHRCACLAGIAVCAVALTAGSASAETLTYTTPGVTDVTLPLGVVNVHVIAVGGRGGGLTGGYGAIVTGDVRVVPRTSPTAAPRIRVIVGGNGSIGVGGSNGGGAAGAAAGLGLPTLAGGGGGATSLELCTLQPDGACRFGDRLIAGGGGGAGAEGLPGTGGAGGSAGRGGSPGSATATLTAAGGGGSPGGSTATGAGGAGSSAVANPDCVDGNSGVHGKFRALGGSGGVSADLAGHGDGGGGGGGLGGGGGGGAGAHCTDDTGTSGGGGGGGSNRVPIGGAAVADTTGQPSVTIMYELEHPRVTIRSPRDGGIYAQGLRVPAIFGCAAPLRFPSATIAACTGTVPSGHRFGTATLGFHDFTVTATDSLGLTFTQTVHYQVTDQTRPRIRRLRISPRTLDASDPGAFSRVVFRLSEQARVRIAVHPLSNEHAARQHARIVTGNAGRNTFRLRARSGRRLLPPDTYRLTLVATDRAGNRSRAIDARFSIVN
jgi:hypothetical protein